MDIQSLSGSMGASAAYRNAQASGATSSQEAVKVEQKKAQEKSESTESSAQAVQEARPAVNASGQMTGTTISVRA